MLHLNNYGGYGRYFGDNGKWVVADIKDSVERAITDYLKANFDL